MTNPTPPAPTPLPPDSVPEWRHITHDSEIFLEYRAPNGPWVQAGIFFPQPGFTVADFMAMVGQLRSAPSSPTAVAASNTEAAARWRDCAEFGWTVIANASGGNWDKESKDWQGAAALFRDQYHKGLDADRAALSTPPPLPAQADRGELRELHDNEKHATDEQRAQWHPPAENRDVAMDRLTTLIRRLRYRGDQYNADIAQMEVMPFLATPTPSPGPTDTERLDWLEGAKSAEYIEGPCGWSINSLPVQHSTLREEIDALIAATGGEGKNL